MSKDNIIKLIQPGNVEDQPTEILRNGARALLAQAVEAEVEDFLGKHSDLKTAGGHQRVVRHCHLPEREVMTGIGPVAVRQPRVRDREADATDPDRIRFSPSILPPSLWPTAQNEGFSRYRSSIWARDTRLASSVLDRERAAKVDSCSSLIANSTARRHPAMIQLLVSPTANEESANNPSVPPIQRAPRRRFHGIGRLVSRPSSPLWNGSKQSRRDRCLVFNSASPAAALRLAVWWLVASGRDSVRSSATDRRRVVPDRFREFRNLRGVMLPAILEH
ncbi:hypothetical protein GGD61_008128 [Bradyrhizobium sp. SBR1B]|nr:hypothetical protein [Bradyrhizobium sp. SBR1B]